MACRAASNIISRAELSQLLPDICSRLVSWCNSNSLKDGICIHSPIIKLGLQDHMYMYMNNNLLSLYSKCCGVGTARQFFDEMPHRDVVSWTGILTAYVGCNRHEEALEVFDSMVFSGVKPNAFTFSSVLRSCSALGVFSYGECVHGSVMKLGLDTNRILGSSLIDFYSKFECIEEASKAFGNVENGDTVSWTMMIYGLVQAGKWSQALRLYIDMVKTGVYPNEFTFVKILGASGFLGWSCGKMVHAQMVVFGVELNLVLKTALVDMYSRCQRMEDAMRVSNLTSECDVYLWTAIISGLAQNSMFMEAIAAFREMEVCGILPNIFTYSTMLSACSSILSLDLGRQVHSRVIITGMEDDVSVGNALVNMYFKCSHSVDDGFRVFREIKFPNVISWTSLIAGFAEHGLFGDSFNLFLEMRSAGVQPNSFTFCVILRSCSIAKSPSQILKLHGHIIKTKADHDVIVGNALVDAYAGSEMVDDAWHVVRNMSQREAATYTSFATRLNQTGHHKLALEIISPMFKDDVKMDGFLMASFLSASTGMGAIETGKQLHCYSVKSGVGRYISASNAIVDMYGKFGNIQDARKAFAEISKPDVVSWNGLISGLTSHGYISAALSAFDDMRLAGVKPDSVTFLLVLNSCSHGGLVDLGLEYFQSMLEDHGIEPQLDHYVCLVDLLGRSGRLEEAIEILDSMPFRPNPVIYKTMLASCKAHGNVPLGEDMARRGVELDPSDPAFYLLLANLYDNCGRSDLAKKTHMLIRHEGQGKRLARA